jgi:hypothetical protein
MAVSPVGLGTKNHCAGDDQQQITGERVEPVSEWVPARVNPSRRGVTSGISPPLVEEEVPFQNT